MPQQFKVDQAATFEGLIIMDAEPKLTYGSDQQERTKDGRPKWELHVYARFRSFGRTVPELIKVGLATYDNPMQGLSTGTPVELIDFEIGIMPDERHDKETGQKKIVGARVWYRCSEVRATSSVGPRKLHAATESA